MEISAQVAGAISVMVALGCGAYLVRSRARQLASQSWPTTNGEIVESNIDEDSDGWIPHVRYAFTVDQQAYESEQIGFYTPNSGTKAYATKQLSQYSVGKKVFIYYNPRNPQDAVLDRKIPLWRSVFWLFLSLFFGVVGVQMWLG